MAELAPLNVIKPIKEGYKHLWKSYNKTQFITAYIIFPLIASAIIILTHTSQELIVFAKNSLLFYSIFVGFLIAALIGILNDNMKSKPKIKQLRHETSNLVLLDVLIATLTMIVSLFIDKLSLPIVWKFFNFESTYLIFFFLFTHFIALILTTMRKFHVIIDENFK